MNFNRSLISRVPTNIITGFLGVGKTSAIMHLMANKPSNERWAVLVNEFGEIGIDGSLLKGQKKQEDQVFIREVPGGCMCCTAGLPMQIALNQLLSEARPDRLLIEPTGLGHPKEVVQVLSTDYYRQILALQKNITLVDARKLSDANYTEHETFNQQITIADTVVGNKRDLYREGDEQKLIDYVSKLGLPNTKVIFSEHGAIPFAEFEGETRINERKKSSILNHEREKKPLIPEAPIPESGILKATNSGEGFFSVGWRISSNKVFDHQQLRLLLVDLKVERMKAVFITGNGIFGYNLTEDGLMEFELDDCPESRLEIIADSLDECFEEQLLRCLDTSSKLKG
ncbi:GTP-binding protein [Vibrio mytili]|uniref:CobW family GTP-binding protein n=1 Tax=Vibrio mytili TaxID=50718 RepID=UPI002F3F5630